MIILGVFGYEITSEDYGDVIMDIDGLDGEEIDDGIIGEE
jgi:hypothetical protein